MPKINIGVGEFIDRYTILELKNTKGLNVIKEFSQYQDVVLNEFGDKLEGFNCYSNILEAINHELWQLEDRRRKEIAINGLFNGERNTANLITKLNDVRSLIKKSADDFFKSEIKEVKSHGLTLET